MSSSSGNEGGTRGSKLSDGAAALPAGKEAEVRAILLREEEKIREMLAPEKDAAEIDVWVSKIVAEVSALESRGGEKGAENSDYTFLAAVETAPQFHCPVCGNRQQSNFMLDAKQGDTICLGADGQGCGTVVQDHKVHEGSMYRKFEGEADRSHHGPAPNRLYSTAHNMRTWISEGKDANRLRNLAEDVEMGLSTIGKDERKTRTAYKDQMKREAFELINQVAGNLNLHEVVTVRAKELFAGWRNVKEHVHHKNPVISACIIAAYREIGTEELYKMFERRQHQAEGREDPLYPFVCAVCMAGFNEAKALDFHQKEVHKSVAAESGELGGAGPTAAMSEWSLSDARGWLSSVVAALELPAEYVQAICTSLEASLKKQEKGQRVGVKRKATRTAGQLLGLLSADKLAEMCGGNEAGAQAAQKIHHETSRKRAERARKDQNRVANYNAAQRKNQIVRKPWVARVNADLNTASAAAETPAAPTNAPVAPAANPPSTSATPSVATPAVMPPPVPPAPALGVAPTLSPVASEVAGVAPAVAPAAVVPPPTAAGAAGLGMVVADAAGQAAGAQTSQTAVVVGTQRISEVEVVPCLGTKLGSGQRTDPVEIDLAG